MRKRRPRAFKGWSDYRSEPADNPELSVTIDSAPMWWPAGTTFYQSEWSLEWDAEEHMWELYWWGPRHHRPRGNRKLRHKNPTVLHTAMVTALLTGVLELPC